MFIQPRQMFLQMLSLSEAGNIYQPTNVEPLRGWQYLLTHTNVLQMLSLSEAGNIFKSITVLISVPIQ